MTTMDNRQVSEIITSLQNPRIKHLRVLQQKSAARRKEGLFVVEGYKELIQCLDAGLQVDALFYTPALMSSAAQELLLRVSSSRCFEVTPEVYDRMAYRGGTEGVIAQVEIPVRTLGGLTLGQHPLIVVVEQVEKPGNLGAILRSADAAGADAVVVCDELTDLYNPNLVRNSIGALFSVPCVSCSSDECIAFLKSKGIRILTAQLQDSNLYYDTDMRVGIALVMGTESTGLSDKWRRAADAHIRIPMLGKLDSLNVSVSTAILLFEAVRQRTCAAETGNS